MPTLTEKINSRECTTGDRPAVMLHYLPAGVADDLTAKAIVKKPMAVYIEKVCEEGDFWQLGIAT